MPAGLIARCSCARGSATRSMLRRPRRADCESWRRSTATAKQGLTGSGSQVSGDDRRHDRLRGSGRAGARRLGGGDGGAVAVHDARRSGRWRRCRRCGRRSTPSRRPIRPTRTTSRTSTTPPAIRTTTSSSSAAGSGSAATDIQVKYMVRCPGALAVERWVTVTPDASGNLVPQVRAVGPADGDARPGRAQPADAGAAHRAGGRGPQRVDRTSSTARSSGSTRVPGSGTPCRAARRPAASASPCRRCRSASSSTPATAATRSSASARRSAVTRDTYRPDIEGCAHRYLNSSAMAPNGATYPVVASHRVARLVVGVDGGGRRPRLPLDDVGRSGDLAVAEMQSVIVNADP